MTPAELSAEVASARRMTLEHTDICTIEESAIVALADALEAARELAEEVVRLRELLTKAGHVVGCLQGGVPCEDDIEFIRCSIEGEGL